jgi:hypothetical protein
MKRLNLYLFFVVYLFNKTGTPEIFDFLQTALFFCEIREPGLGNILIRDPRILREEYKTLVNKQMVKLFKTIEYQSAC